MIHSQKRILALDVHPRSFGFAAFEGKDRLLDWGVRSFRSGANAVRVPAARKVGLLLDEFAPEAIVLKAPERRKFRGRSKLAATVQREARKRRIALRFLPRSAVKRAIGQNVRNKHEIAILLTGRYPELSWRLPPRRKSWQSEDYRMGIFDAAALGVAYFHRYLNRVDAVLPENPIPF